MFIEEIIAKMTDDLDFNLSAKKMERDGRVPEVASNQPIYFRKPNREIRPRFASGSGIG
jgi:hypothetical protein